MPMAQTSLVAVIAASRRSMPKGSGVSQQMLSLVQVSGLKVAPTLASAVGVNVQTAG